MLHFSKACRRLLASNEQLSLVQLTRSSMTHVGVASVACLRHALVSMSSLACCSVFG
jgi:hypothetical protein